MTAPPDIPSDKLTGDAAVLEDPVVIELFDEHGNLKDQRRGGGHL